MTTKVTHKGKNLRNQYGNPNLKFHSVCVDNFFNNPDLIREFALNQEYFPTDGRYPGERTSNMWQINKTLSDYLFAKIFSVYFPVRGYQIKFEKADITFQKIKSFSDIENSWKNTGWIHTDNDYSLAGLVYLTPNFNMNGGTSLFNLKKEFSDIHSDYEMTPMKNKLYSGTKISDDEYKNALEKYNSKFEEKTEFKNIYNRLIAYDGHEYHGAKSFYNNTGDERLTLVFFIDGITIEKSPYEVFKGKIDESIESEIRK